MDKEREDIVLLIIDEFWKACQNTDEKNSFLYKILNLHEKHGGINYWVSDSVCYLHPFLQKDKEN